MIFSRNFLQLVHIDVHFLRLRFRRLLLVRFRFRCRNRVWFFVPVSGWLSVPVSGAGGDGTSSGGFVSVVGRLASMIRWLAVTRASSFLLLAPSSASVRAFVVAPRRLAAPCCSPVVFSSVPVVITTALIVVTVSGSRLVVVPGIVVAVSPAFVLISPGGVVFVFISGRVVAFVFVVILIVSTPTAPGVVLVVVLVVLVPRLARSLVKHFEIAAIWVLRRVDVVRHPSHSLAAAVGRRPVVDDLNRHPLLRLLIVVVKGLGEARVPLLAGKLLFHNLVKIAPVHRIVQPHMLLEELLGFPQLAIQ
mmetsp:Transcript_17315/g.43034  ORF Transcript_17315/g.43034 Transcript_17315/m.43034 type:complete len:305 (+) Transcript_17315:782-1696(+)